MSESSPDESSSKRKDFICGVVEGFYGRPWTTEQRKDLFQKLKKWGMDMYVYAPKDDYKHRAYWRELYTVEEAEHLTSLISAAKEQGITFCYALSPGLDITYSNQKEITTLKRKLEQVSQFGCSCFALLFDDIEPEMSEADKQTFQSFAHAQVSITNEVHQHLGCPKFLLCPTQYCSTRAVPNVNSSEYLNTLGTKLSQQIDIMWTGPKVISKTLTTECIEEITQVLRRPPVIWDNLHANDYDQKRVFLGPYVGRSPSLIPLLRGVLSNPNCEYNANIVPVRTLAHWAHCSHIAVPMEAVSWDIKLERESEHGVCDDDEPPPAAHVYHHRHALRQAITEWLPEFSIAKTAQGPVVKPQPPIVPPVPIIPIMPSVNTCMSLVTVTSNTTTTSSAQMSSAIPTVNTSQLQALADVGVNQDRPIISTGFCPQASAVETFNPVSNPVMNSLVSPTKVILNESIPNPIIPSNIPVPSELPISSLPVPILGLKIESNNSDTVMEKSDSAVSESVMVESEEKKKEDAIVVDDERNGDMSLGDTPQTLSPRAAAISGEDQETGSDVLMNDDLTENGSMQVEPSNSPMSNDMMVESNDGIDTGDDVSNDISEPAELTSVDAISVEDLILLCELFYLPFEHGARGLRLLHDFHWLLTHAHTLLNKKQQHETSEWRRRRARFAWWVSRTKRLARRLDLCANRELCAELQPYVLDVCCVLALLAGFVSWLELGKFPANILSNTQGSYTWFSKGWREAFESGAQEPWVFRGGVAAEMRRLLPAAGDVVADLPSVIRPATHADHEQIYELCRKTCRDGSDGSDLFPADLQNLPGDRLVGAFLTLEPSLCMVMEHDRELDSMSSVDGDGKLRVNGVNPTILGYAMAAVNSKEFYRKQEMAWIPEMCAKYPAELASRGDLGDVAKECISDFHGFSAASRRWFPAQPALVTCGAGAVTPAAAGATTAGATTPAAARALTCLLAALTAHGVPGAHACINAADVNLMQFYNKLGFVEIARDEGRVYLGRTF